MFVSFIAVWRSFSKRSTSKPELVSTYTECRSGYQGERRVGEMDVDRPEARDEESRRCGPMRAATSIPASAAMTVFAESGVDAPIRTIAAEAGVGVGTLYRHFPQRSDLIKAIIQREVDACVEAAATLGTTQTPGEALASWVQRPVDFVATKRGLGPALHSGDAAYKSLPNYVLGQLTPALRGLLDAAAAAGEIWPTWTPASCCWRPCGWQRRQAMVRLRRRAGWWRCSSMVCATRGRANPRRPRPNLSAGTGPGDRRRPVPRASAAPRRAGPRRRGSASSVPAAPAPRCASLGLDPRRGGVADAGAGLGGGEAVDRGIADAGRDCERVAQDHLGQRRDQHVGAPARP